MFFLQEMNGRLRKESYLAQVEAEVLFSPDCSQVVHKGPRELLAMAAQGEVTIRGREVTPAMVALAVNQRAISNRWRAMTMEERQVYESLAKEEKEL